VVVRVEASTVWRRWRLSVLTWSQSLDEMVGETAAASLSGKKRRVAVGVS